ncbi:hypothetical protein D3C78_590450 [compost metagenome]
MHTSAVSLQLAQHQFQQRGLAATVRADQRDFIATLDLSREVTHQHFTINLIINVFHFEDDFAGAGRFFDLHFRRAHHFAALAAFVTHRFQRTYAAFVTGTTGFDALTDPDFFLRQFAIKLSVLELFDAQVFFFFQQIGIIAAWIRHQLSAIQIDNARRHIANKRTVM